MLYKLLNTGNYKRLKRLLKGSCEQVISDWKWDAMISEHMRKPWTYEEAVRYIKNLKVYKLEEEQLGIEPMDPLSDRDRDLFLDMLADPPEPNEELKRAMKEYDELFSKVLVKHKRTLDLLGDE